MLVQVVVGIVVESKATLLPCRVILAIGHPSVVLKSGP